MNNKSSEKNLFVTFPVDFGNATLEANLKKIFSNEMDFFRFAGDHAENIHKKKITLFESILYRLKSTISLRKKVKQSTQNGGVIIFQNISPALFSFGIWNAKRSIIVLDWTRTLMHQIYKSKIKRDIFFYLHRIILNRCNKIFCWTDAALNNIHTIYGIDKSKLFKVPAPFLINELSISPRKTPNKPRVLFIGGDWLRKGGDVLLNNWENRLKQKCELTILTSNKFLKKEGVNVFTDIRYGTPDHKEIFKQNDILILPARFDAYPQVIGEAAAGGLAVIATQYALGSPEVIVHGRTGYIAQNPEESIEYLIKLLENIDLIDDFKKEGYKHMQSKFGIEEIKHKYFKAIAE